VSTLIVLATAGLVLATALAGHRDWRLALLGNFRAHLAAASLFVAALAAFADIVWPFDGLVIVLMLLCAAANIYEMLRATRPARVKVAGDGRAVRLVFANLLETNLATDRVIEWLARDRPDVFICAEAHRHWRRALTVLEEDYPHVAGSAQGDVMIFSRRPFEAEPIDLFVDIGHAVAVQVDGLTIVGLHTASPEDLRRSTALEELLDQAGTFLRGTTGPVVVTGDFNATPWTPPVRRLMAETGLRCAPGALAGTYPAALLGRMVPPWLAIPIDIVLAGGGAHAVSRRRGPSIGSDHWPVVVELVLADRGDVKPTT
jgi:endonuclease/exonuclease/phosphatase (EEP) superfamily protein YafD